MIMAITVSPVTPSFAAEIGDVDLAGQIDPADPRPEQSDQGAPDQPAKIAHRERVSADWRSRSAVLGLR
jgi:hypothetical protein